MCHLLFLDDEDDDDDDELQDEEHGERAPARLASVNLNGLNNVNSGHTLTARSTRDLIRSLSLLTHSVNFPTLSLLPSTLFGSTTRPSRRILTTANHSSSPKTQIRYSNMAASKSYWWVTLWFLLSAPVIFWDASFCFMRYAPCLLSMSTTC